MATYEHNGIEIQFIESSGKFIAECLGANMTATSLAGLKKKIDKAKQFQPFTALVKENWGTKYHRITIVSYKKPRENSWRDKGTWRDDKGKDLDGQVYVDTPENEATLKAALALDARQSEEMAALREQHRLNTVAAWDAVKKVEMPEQP